MKISAGMPQKSNVTTERNVPGNHLDFPPFDPGVVVQSAGARWGYVYATRRLALYSAIANTFVMFLMLSGIPGASTAIQDVGENNTRRAVIHTVIVLLSVLLLWKPDVISYLKTLAHSTRVSINVNSGTPP